VLNFKLNINQYQGKKFNISLYIDPCFLRSIQKVRNQQDWIPIFLSYLVKALVINIQSQVSILFFYKHN